MKIMKISDPDIETAARKTASHIKRYLLTKGPSHDDPLEVGRKAAEQALQNVGEVPFLLFVTTHADKQAGVILSIDADAETYADDRDRFIRAILLLVNAKSYAIASEMWTSAKNMQPSQDPEREEGVMVTAVDAMHTRVAMARIKRDAEGKPSLEAWESWDDLGGRMTSLLPEVQTGHA